MRYWISHFLAFKSVTSGLKSILKSVNRYIHSTDVVPTLQWKWFLGSDPEPGNILCYRDFRVRITDLYSKQAAERIPLGLVFYKLGPGK